jgi:hypothetical protein
MGNVMMVVLGQCTVSARMAQIARIAVTDTLTPATILAHTLPMVSVTMVAQDRCTVCAAMEAIAPTVVIGILWQI